MQSIKGTIQKSTLSGGFWELVSDSGEHYQLDTTDSGLLKEGLKVTVKGEVASDMMGIGMGSGVLKIKEWKKL